jgi:hypothetical protein
LKKNNPTEAMDSPRYGTNRTGGNIALLALNKQEHPQNLFQVGWRDLQNKLDQLKVDFV